MVIKKYLQASFKCVLLLLIAILLVSCILQSKDTRTRSADGMEQVYIRAGNFMMGNTDTELNWVLAHSCRGGCRRSWFEDEQPAHQVTLDAYWIDKYEVSNAQYKLCVDAGMCDPPENTRSRTQDWYYGNSQYANYPVINVDWNDANAYCSWVGGSLPTEAQWEYAARGDNSRAYPWGKRMDGSRANICDSNCPFSGRLAINDGYVETAPVGSYPSGASPYGVLDMAGNVSEWVADWYGSYSSAAQTNPTGPTTGDDKVLRGGNWSNSWFHVGATSRSYDDPDSYFYLQGFRCVSPAP